MEFPDFNEIRARIKALPLCGTIKILELFQVTPKKYPWFICEYDNKCNIPFPSDWLLFCDDTFICNVTIVSMAMVNYGKTRPNVITLCAVERIDKELFDFSKNMHFRRVISNEI